MGDLFLFRRPSVLPEGQEMEEIHDSRVFAPIYPLRCDSSTLKALRKTSWPARSQIVNIRLRRDGDDCAVLIDSLSTKYVNRTWWTIR